MNKLQEFYLFRKKDHSGISGVGVVARGIILPSHRVVMEWSMPFETITHFQNIGEVEKIHGHGGSTELIMGTPPKKQTERVVMDYPTAWDYLKKTKLTQHHSKCSYRTEKRAILCDCDIINNEYSKREDLLEKKK